MSESQKEYINSSSFKGFKIMHNGPSAFKAIFPEGSVIIRSRGGKYDLWDGDESDYVSLNLQQHDYHIDAYVFVIGVAKMFYIVGWIMYDELLEKGEALIDSETVYLTIPINKLHSPKELDGLVKEMVRPE